jgi:hypothetical protein
VFGGRQITLANTNPTSKIGLRNIETPQVYIRILEYSTKVSPTCS